MEEVFVVLQNSNLGADMTIATSLIEIGVLGGPLILAVCQFLNDRSTSRTDRQKLVETVLLGSLGLMSILLMWSLFLVGSLWIWNETMYSPTSEILFSFTVLYFLFVLLIMFYQFRAIVDSRLKPTVASYIFAVFAGITTILVYIQGAVTQVGMYLLTSIVIFWFLLGTVMHPQIGPSLYDYILSLQETDGDDNPHADEVNRDFEKEWWWVWDEEDEHN